MLKSTVLYLQLQNDLILEYLNFQRLTEEQIIKYYYKMWSQIWGYVKEKQILRILQLDFKIFLRDINWLPCSQSKFQFTKLIQKG